MTLPLPKNFKNYFGVRKETGTEEERSMSALDY